MPAPANDNFASAEVISGFSGTADGTNVEATVEAGEPTGSKTVWFKWTTPDHLAHGVHWRHAMFFSTRYNAGSPVSPLKTIVRVFQGTAVDDLTEVGYLRTSQSYSAGGWERGSQVVFNAQLNVSSGVGEDYYIRVDGFNGEEGEFLLTWGKYRTQTFNACSQQTMNLGIGETCEAILTLDDVRVSSSHQDFGTFGLGNYIVRYVRGAWCAHSPFADWSVVPPELGSQLLRIKDAVGTQINFSQQERWDTYADAELRSWCVYARLIQPSSGLIQLYFDDFLAQNLNAEEVDATYTNPMFALYRVRPVFIEFGASVFHISGNRFRGTFTIKNLTQSDWVDITVTLQAIGNISGVGSTPLWAVGALSNAPVPEIEFDILPAGNTSAIATLQLTNGGIDTFDSLVFDITPRISAEVLTVGYGAACIDNPIGVMNVTVMNSGFCQTVDLVATVTALTPGIDRFRRPSDCAITNVFSVGAINPNGGTAALSIRFHRTDASIVAATLRFQFQDGPVDHGTFDFDITF